MDAIIPPPAKLQTKFLFFPVSVYGRFRLNIPRPGNTSQKWVVQMLGHS